MQRKKILRFLETVPPYAQDVEKVLSSFMQDVEKKHGWIPCSGGGDFDQNMHSIHLGFLTKKNLTRDEAKKLLASELLLLKEKINSNKRVIPFLEEYPMNERSISLQLLTPDQRFFNSEDLFPEFKNLPVNKKLRKYFD